LAALFGHRAAQMIDLAVSVFPERPTLSDVRGHMAAGIAAAGSSAVAQATASLLDLIPTQPEHAERLGQLREWVSRVLAGEDGGVEGLAPTGESTIDAAQAICLAAKRARSDSRPSAAVARTLAVCVGLVAGERESRLPWATPAEVAQVWRSRLVPWLVHGPSLGSP